MIGFDRAQTAYENREPENDDACDGCADNDCDECGLCEARHCEKETAADEDDAYWDMKYEDYRESQWPDP